LFKRKKRSWLFYFLIFSGGGSLFFLNRFVVSFSSVPRYIYSSLVYPVLLSQRYIVVPIKDYFKTRKSQQILEEMVFQLHKEKEDLTEENIKLRASAFFYDQVKEVLAFKDRYESHDLLLAQVIFKHVNANAHFFFINKGSFHGVQKDMVAVHKNCLLGRIIEIYPYYSKVVLVTDKSCKVASYCQGTKAYGIHVGQNKQHCTSLSRVSHLASIKKDDLIISSGDGLIFPQGFAIGTTSLIKKGDLYYEIQVKPLFDLKKIQYCFLMKKGSYNPN